MLKQGRRFARVAERYREAMLNNDEAAIALLEKVCLFRLGVDCETLAAIFTGASATKVSGKALAGLSAEQLQEKLDWLVRMRIVEATEASSLKTENSAPNTTYSIHPAVRDGFLGGLGLEDREASHEAVRQGLTVSLGDAPGENPSDPATLDALEEIVHHTLQSGHVPEAWDIHRNRIGGFQNLGWRLGAYERGERICRAFAGGESPESVVGFVRIRYRDQNDRVFADSATQNELSYMALPENIQAIFFNEWALYLKQFGRLFAAVRCHELYVESSLRREDWVNATIGKQNLCHVLLLSGRLTGSAGRGALPTANEALNLAVRVDNARERRRSHAYAAHARVLRGEVPAALADFRAALDWQHKDETDASDLPLYSVYGIYHTHLLVRLCRREGAMRLTERNKEILLENWGSDDNEIPHCNLVLADLPGEPIDASLQRSLCQSARGWAEARNAKEILCWSALVQARIELRTPSAVSDQPSAAQEGRAKHLTAAAASITEGLKIARDCGYGIFHIDLLLERARVHLLRGDPQSALKDIALSLDDGISVNDETGQPELLAANHEECGYAWAIPHGLQLRAEAQLLQAARQLGADSFVIAKRSDLTDDVQTLIESAESNLNEALAKWQPLHDPEPEREDQNFKHPETDDEYNFRAAETWLILQDLAGGVLTRYPLETATEPEPTPQQGEQQEPSAEERTKPTMPLPDGPRSVFISYAHADNVTDDPMKRWLDRFVTFLKPCVRQEDFTLCSDKDIRIGDDWREHIKAHLAGADAAVLLISPNYLASDFIADNELPILLKQAVDDGLKVFPILISPSMYERTKFKYPDSKTGPNEFELSSLQSANPPSKTLVEMDEGEQNRVLKKVAEQLADLLKP